MHAAGGKHLFREKSPFNDRVGRPGKSGFTLIEVLIAMFVSTVGLLALAMLQAHAIKDNGYANRLSQATLLAQARIEQLNGSLLSLDDTVGNDLKVDAGGIEANIGQDGALGGPFTLSWAVAPHTLFSRRVTVAVTWSDQRAVARGTPNKVEFSSITRGIFHE